MLFLFNIISALLTKVLINPNFTNLIELMDLIILLIGIALGFAGSFISSLKNSQLLGKEK